MGDWRTRSGQFIEQGENDFTTDAGYKALTSSATAHVKGAYTELVTATDFECIALCLYFLPSFSTRQFLIDIAIGPGTSEQVIIANILAPRYGIFDGNQTNIIVPFNIPTGTRIAARIQTDGVGAATFEIGCCPIYAGFDPEKGYDRCETFGANAGTTRGTVIDCGGTAHTFGSFVQITASLNSNCRGMMVSCGNNGNAAPANTEFIINIARGTGDEIVVPGIEMYAIAGNANLHGWLNGVFPVSIPAGQKVSAQAMCSVTNATDRQFDLVLHCFD